MVITKTASRNIAIKFKVAKMSETAIETQAAFIACGVGEEALSLEHESLEDLELVVKAYAWTVLCLCASE